MNEDRKLRRKITGLWNDLTNNQTFSPVDFNKSRAFMRLEITLIENGLLSERRERPSERAMKKATTGV